MPTAADYFHNDGLFASAYFERVLADPSLPSGYALPSDARERLARLVALWERQRDTLMRDTRASGKPAKLRYIGLPEHYEPLPGPSESDVENGFIRPLFEDVLGYAVVQNRHLMLQGAAALGIQARQRPDLVLYADRQAYEQVLKSWGANETDGGATPDGAHFCRSAALIVDAKRFQKGVGADEEAQPATKKQRTEATAIEDVQQVDRYLRGYDKRWGVLTNGRSLRLMRAGREHVHLRFDLVCFLEAVRGREATNDDLLVFGLFWHLFGFPGAAGGYLDALERESEANQRRVRDVLRRQAHEAVETIAQGFWGAADNAGHGLTVAPTLPTQAELDKLREISLTLLYRLLFVLKAEAQSLLPMRDDKGAESSYARKRSSAAIYRKLAETAPEDRARFSEGYEDLLRLFADIDRGSATYGIPAYNGGLFDPERHPELTHWRLLDASLFEILGELIYLDGESRNPVPYADLDVRDLGDIYEGLLEQRLTATPSEPPSLHLRNQKGERKGSGSYFTPDGLVDHLVRRALMPLLEAAGDDPAKVLALRVLDPAMGSGHFLVKVVDVMADYLTVHCDPPDPEAPRDNGPAERAYWKRVVVESCIYGVDYNPMAVELARVSLWLHTAEYGRPLSFLDHHLAVGNSLVGARYDRLASPGLELKTARKGATWQPVAKLESEPGPVEPTTASKPPPPKKSGGKKAKARDAAQIALPFAIDTALFSGILESIRAILARPSSSADEVKKKSRDYARAVEQKLEAHRLLADLWCLQWFSGEPTEETIRAYCHPDGLYAEVKRICGIQVDAVRHAALEAVREHPLVQRVEAARRHGYGPRLESFFHWQLAFPDVAFGPGGQAREGFGFDAVVGNPPWDRIRPERRHFYGPYGRPDQGKAWDVANTQGASLEALIAKLHAEHPGLDRGWAEYEADVGSLTTYLRGSGEYTRQVVEIDGKKTGGDPDTFRYFVERGFHALRKGGRFAYVVPGTLWQAEGCTGLRRMLLEEATTEELYVFENYRKWAFDIDSRFKFTTVVARAEPAPKAHRFPAGFMLRDLRALHGRLPERVVEMSHELAEALSPGTLAMLDLQSDGDAKLIGRLHAEHPALGSTESGWALKYRCELHMTNDAWRFKTREWMRSRGFLRVVPEKQADGSWVQRRENGSPTASYPSELPAGGEYWVAADAAWYRARGYLAETQQVGAAEREVFVHPEDANEAAVRGVGAKQRERIVPGARYTALYEGRMVHNLDHAKKRYLSGEGRRAVWEDLPIEDKVLAPRVFVSEPDAGSAVSRAGFCDVTGATNERSMLATLLPDGFGCGNKVPTLVSDVTLGSSATAAFLASFVWDWAVRFRISTTLNWTYVSRVVVPGRSALTDDSLSALARAVATVVCTTPELADAWNEVFPDQPWTYASAERDPWKRGVLRAELDAIVAELYGLSSAEYARVLTGFPLLDRDQPPLSGDCFITDANSDEPSGTPGVDWERNDWGVYEKKARSFITRDLALLTYMRRRGEAPPQDLHRYYVEQVGLDPEGPLSRFRIGEVRDLIDRVELAKKLGAVAYVPSGRGGGASEDEAGDDAAEGEEG